MGACSEQSGLALVSFQVASMLDVMGAVNHKHHATVRYTPSKQASVSCLKVNAIYGIKKLMINSSTMSFKEVHAPGRPSCLAARL